MTNPFKPGKIFDQQPRSEVRDANLICFHLFVCLAEEQEQLKSVSIGGDGVRTQVPLSGQIAREKSIDM
jgi:hypothetical protein